MGGSFFTDDKTICRLSISVSSENEYCIGFTPLDDNVVDTAGETVVWSRNFHGVANAMAYKLLLENLSPGSIRNIIRNVPPCGM